MECKQNTPGNNESNNPNKWPIPKQTECTWQWHSSGNKMSTCLKFGITYQKQAQTVTDNVQQLRKPSTTQNQQFEIHKPGNHLSLYPCLAENCPPQQFWESQGHYQNNQENIFHSTNHPETLLAPQNTTTHAAILRVLRANTTKETTLMLGC